MNPDLRPGSSDHYPAAVRHSLRVYSLCSFDPEQVVPVVELIDAESDEHAIALARSRGFRMRREIWDHHRLVAALPPAI
jgi:hypothetical protein